MEINFSKAEIAYIKESVISYSESFGIYEYDQKLKFELYKSIIEKIENNYHSRELLSLLED